MACRPDLRLLATWLAVCALTVAASAAPVRDRLGEAAEALARGDGIAAEIAAGDALRNSVAVSDVAALIGEAKLVQGDLSDSRKWLASGEFSPATRERGFHALGRLEMQEGNLAAATAAFDQALQSGPGSARLWVDIGRLRYLAGQHRPALAAAAQALAIDPAEPRALEFEAQLARDAHGLLAALSLFEKALETAPDDLGLLGEYAATLGEAGRHADMLRVARRMVELDPRHPRAYYLQAILAARAGLDHLARRLLSRTGGAYDNAPATQLLVGVLELRNGNAALAVERFDDLVRRQPENDLVRLLLGRALLANGEANEVIARLAPAADRSDASPYLLALVGRAYEQLDRRDEASGYLNRAKVDHAAPIEAVVADSRAAVSTGIVGEVSRIRHLMAQGRTGEAGRAAKGLRAAFPDSIDVDILSGDVSLLSGDPAAALTAYRRAAEVRRNFALVDRMAAAHRALGRDDEAREVLTGYLAQNPRSAAASAMLGRIASARGDWRQARLLLAHASELRPADAGLLADLAQAELALGETQAAKKAARAAYSLHRSNPLVAATLARILAASEGVGAERRALLAKARRSSSPSEG